MLKAASGFCCYQVLVSAIKSYPMSVLGFYPCISDQFLCMSACVFGLMLEDFRKRSNFRLPLVEWNVKLAPENSNVSCSSYDNEIDAWQKGFNFQYISSVELHYWGQ